MSEFCRAFNKLFGITSKTSKNTEWTNINSTSTSTRSKLRKIPRFRGTRKQKLRLRHSTKKSISSISKMSKDSITTSHPTRSEALNNKNIIRSNQQKNDTHSTNIKEGVLKLLSQSKKNETADKIIKGMKELINKK